MIRTEALTRRYLMGDQTISAVDGIDLHIAPGEAVALLGPSGSGKSTLMHLLGALDTPSSGTLSIGGRQIGDFSDREAALYRSRNVGFVFQSFYLQAHLTALENVALPMRFAGIPADERGAKARELLTLVGLGDRVDHRPNELSGGQQQRVSIARALANDPRLILADEPTGNLDTKTSQEIIELFARLRAERGLTLVVVTHDPDVAAEMERTVRMRDGKIESIVGEAPSETASPLLPVVTAAAGPGLGESIGEAFLGFRRHPLRSMLTAVGIAVGGLAICLMVGLGMGLHQFITEQTEAVNDPLSLWVVNSSYGWQDIVGSRAKSFGKPPVPLKSKALVRIAKARGGFDAFKDEQVAEIRKVPGVSSVRPRSYVVIDGIRLVDQGQERLDSKQPAASDVEAEPAHFDATYYVSFSLVRGVGTEFPLSAGRLFAKGEPRGVVLANQFAEAWGLPVEALVGREVELLFPELSGYGQLSWAVSSKVQAKYRGFRAKVVGVTKKSILSAAVFLPPHFGEEVSKFQFGGRMAGNAMSGGFASLGRMQELSGVASDPKLLSELAAAGGKQAELAITLKLLRRSGSGGGKRGGNPMVMLGQVGRLRQLAQDEQLRKALVAAGGERQRLGELVGKLFPSPELASARADEPDGKSGAKKPRSWGSTLRVRVDGLAQLESVKKALKEKGYRVRSLKENLDSIGIVFGVVDAFLSSFGLIALFVAALGIANTLIMAVYERTQEIGVMKAVGATQEHIRRSFAMEAAAIGLVGGVAGVIFALIAGFGINEWGVQLIAQEWKGYEFFVAPPELCIGTVFFCALIGLVAGLYPAHRAAQLDPIAALRSD